MKSSELILLPAAVLLGIGLIGFAIVVFLPASAVTEMGHHIFGNAIYIFNQSDSCVPWAIIVWAGIAFAWIYRRRASKGLQEEEDTGQKMKEYLESERVQDDSHTETRRNIAMQREMQDGNGLAVPEGPASFIPEDYPEVLQQSSVGRGGRVDPHGYPSTLQDALRWKLIQSILAGEVEIDALTGKIDSESLASDNPSIKFGGLTFRVKPKAPAATATATAMATEKASVISPTQDDDIPLASEEVDKEEED